MPELKRITIGDQDFAGDLSGGPMVIGRHKTANIRIDDDHLVSRFHCRIEESELGPVLHDLKSSNGTWIGEKKIDWVLLKDITEVRVGSTVVRFEVERGEGADRIESMLHAVDEPAPINPDDPTWSAMGDESASTLAPNDLYADEDGEPTPIFKQGSYNFESLLKLGESQAAKNDGLKLDQLALHNSRGQVVHAASNDEGASETAKSIRMLRQLLMLCLRTGASDVHLEPVDDAGLLRIRVDGAMVSVGNMPGRDRERLASVVKILCDIDITKKATIQEGHFSCRVPGRRIDYRASYTPAVRGQKMVLRVLDPINAPQKIRDLGMSDWMYRQIRGVLRKDTGMLLVCGPTGSGKTTTLYAALRQIDTATRNIITIEDPVEYEVPGVTQMPVDVDQGATFHSLLRSCLRQDPDVVVLGEVRDADTAVTAMQAGSTGHLVLSTIHAKDTVGIIFRLLDLGVEPYLVASTINLLLAQRLVRRLCPDCKIERTAKPRETMQLGKRIEGAGTLFSPMGCDACFQTGYRGRLAIYEMLVTNDKLRDTIIREPNMAAIRASVELGDFTSLLDGARELVLTGETSMEEVERTVGWD